MQTIDSHIWIRAKQSFSTGVVSLSVYGRRNRLFFNPNPVSLRKQRLPRAVVLFSVYERRNRLCVNALRTRL